MNSHLKTYKIILKTLSPVYIGSGKKINKKEYIFDFAAQKVHIPDFEKMFGYLYSKNLLQKYQDYLLKENFLDLAGWLKSCNITAKDYMPWVSYTISCGDALEEMKSRKEINTFIKDAYGCPYIPGSSLKGAVRTALLASDILQNKAKYTRIAADTLNNSCTDRKKRLLSNEVKAAEVICFNTLERADKYAVPVKKSNAVNDIMSGMRISDSAPLDTSCLTLCQKIDENTAGVERKMPLLRECLKPGTAIQFDLTIDTSVCHFDKDDIMSAINTFAQNNARCFDIAFKSNGAMPKDIILLGGGTGYQTKTVSYALLGKSPHTVEQISKIIDATLNKKAKSEHKHCKDQRLGVSPHIVKRTYYMKKKYTMGACTIKIL